MLIGGFGGGGILVRDPILTNSPLGFWRYGHGRELATALIYLGVVLMAYAWIRLGREVLAERVGGRAVLTTAGVWLIPLLVTPPLFTRDVFSYLAQGALPLAGFDPYAVGPEAMPGIFTTNVHYFWQDTPAPYGPLFILLAKTVAWAAGTNIIVGVLLMRLTLVVGLVLLVWALPELTRRLGGRVPVALWVAVANPMMIIHMVGGGHNDLLVMGLLATGSLFALRGRHVVGIMLVTAAMAVKASAGVALPFLVLVWAAHLSGSRTARITKAAAAGIGVFAGTFGLITLAARVDLGWLPALSAPSMIVNWMSLPTGVGEFVHWLLEIPFDLPKQPFINVARILGGIVAAGDRGPAVVGRARRRPGRGPAGRDRADGRRGALPGDAALVPELGHGAGRRGPVVAPGAVVARVRLVDAGDRLLPERRRRPLQLALPRRRAPRCPRWPRCRCTGSTRCT